MSSSSTAPERPSSMSSSGSPKRVKRKVVSKRDTQAAPEEHAKKDLKMHGAQEAKRAMEQDAEKETSLLAELAASLTESTKPTEVGGIHPAQLSGDEEETTKDTLLLEEPEPALDRLDELSLSEPSVVKSSRRASHPQSNEDESPGVAVDVERENLLAKKVGGKGASGDVGVGEDTGSVHVGKQEEIHSMGIPGKVDEDWESRLFVQGPSKLLTEEFIQENFSEFGSLEYVKLLYKGGKPKGMAFVKFTSVQAASLAVRTVVENEDMVGTVPVKVSIAEPQKEPKQKKTKESVAEPQKEPKPQNCKINQKRQRDSPNPEATAASRQRKIDKPRRTPMAAVTPSFQPQSYLPYQAQYLDGALAVAPIVDTRGMPMNMPMGMPVPPFHPGHYAPPGVGFLAGTSGGFDWQQHQHGFFPGQGHVPHNNGVYGYPMHMHMAANVMASAQQHEQRAQHFAGYSTPPNVNAAGVDHAVELSKRKKRGTKRNSEMNSPKSECLIDRGEQVDEASRGSSSAKRGRMKAHIPSTTLQQKLEHFEEETATSLLPLLDRFEEEGIDFQVFLALTQEDMKELGLKMGDRKRVVMAQEFFTEQQSREEEDRVK